MSRMSKNPSFVIYGLNGEKKLRGTVKINGAKNAALKAMAAAILFDGPVTLENMPDNDDIRTMADILRKLGAVVSNKDAHALCIDPSTIKSTDIDPKLACSMRASVVLTGPLLARFDKVSFPAPGGCVIGARPIDLFLEGYEKMGAKVILDQEKCIYDIKTSGNRPDNKLASAEISFKKISVGATETLMMAAVLGNGTTIINNCALEPEIVNVAEWLNACGAKIKGVGTSTIEIEGTGGKLLSAKAAEDKPYIAIPDRIEAGSFLILGALCASELTIENCRPDHLSAIIKLLQDSGVKIELSADSIRVTNSNSATVSDVGVLRAFDFTTSEYPGIATDLQAPLVVFLTQAKGQSKVVETVFEDRFKYVDDLNSLGAKIETIGSQEIIINGPTPLKSLPEGKAIKALDIRAGFAVVMTALVGKGRFTVDNVHLIDRGYEKLEDRLMALGAKIERKTEE
jgi:UDP-N-acetylglucosamine 1-carboxyvinyltransferase